jgi:hypothetical protein
MNSKLCELKELLACVIYRYCATPITTSYIACGAIEMLWYIGAYRRVDTFRVSWRDKKKLAEN